MNSFEVMAIRSVDAENWLIDTIMAYGNFAKEDALIVIALYKKKKWVKLDLMHSRYLLKAGNILDKTFLTDALNFAKESK